MSGLRKTIVVALCGLSVAAGCSDEPTTREAHRAGYYAPAESLAGEMTDEWKAFAERADRTCVKHFRGVDFLQDVAYQVAEDRELSANQTEALTWRVLARGVRGEALALVRLGNPPTRRRLWSRVVANMARRADLADKISAAWRRGDSSAASLLKARRDAMKIDFNHMGQRFGLLICTSNGPGLEPGEYPYESQAARDAYLERVNDVCANRDQRESRYQREGRLGPGPTFGLSIGETIDMAAVGPPPGNYGLRQHILATKRRLDHWWKRMLIKTNRSPNHARTFDRLTPAWIRLAVHTQREFAELGLPACANWGPAAN